MLIRLLFCRPCARRSTWLKNVVLCLNSTPIQSRMSKIRITIEILTEVLSNNATIVIMAPIALELANQLNMDLENARAYVLTACIAASASFVTPIGYQTNTFVYTVGGYRFRDFMKIGIFFNLIYFVGTILLVSWIWDLAP